MAGNIYFLATKVSHLCEDNWKSLHINGMARGYSWGYSSYSFIYLKCEVWHGVNLFNVANKKFVYCQFKDFLITFMREFSSQLPSVFFLLTETEK